jgi:hypothetical protein
LFNDGTSATYFYFPGTNGLMYWNEAIGGVPSIIAGSVDWDGSGALEIDALASSYGSGLISFPSAGEDVYGNIYLTFWAIVENTFDPAGNALGHSYLIYSRDGGQLWSSFDGEEGPIDFTTQDGVSEGCYSSIVRRVANDRIDIFTQEDVCAGQGVSTDAGGAVIDPCNTGQTNLILAVSIDNFLTAIPSLNQPLAAVEVYPVPSQGWLSIDGIEEKQVDITVINALGQVAARFENMKPEGKKLQLDLSALPDGFYQLGFMNNGVVASGKITIHK